jgi:hypothetical protein
LNNWLAHVPPEIRARAYRSDHELAWSREDAVHVVEVLRPHFVVIGVEIWLPTTPGPTIPTPFVYVWDAERQKSGAANATLYIRNFRWDDADVGHRDLEPYFNLTVIPLDA